MSSVVILEPICLNTTYNLYATLNTLILAQSAKTIIVRRQTLYA